MDRPADLELGPLLARAGAALGEAQRSLLEHERVIIDALASRHLDGALARDLQHMDLVSQIMADLSRLLTAVAGAGPGEVRLPRHAVAGALRLERLRHDLLGEEANADDLTPVELF